MLTEKSESGTRIRDREVPLADLSTRQLVALASRISQINRAVNRTHTSEDSVGVARGLSALRSAERRLLNAGRQLQLARKEVLKQPHGGILHVKQECSRAIIETAQAFDLVYGEARAMREQSQRLVRITEGFVLREDNVKTIYRQLCGLRDQAVDAAIVLPNWRVGSLSWRIQGIVLSDAELSVPFDDIHCSWPIASILPGSRIAKVYCRGGNHCREVSNIHPHVSCYGELCGGDQALSLRVAFEAGRWADGVALSAELLHDYTHEGAYAPLACWVDKFECPHCGRLRRADRFNTCTSCGQSVCCAMSCAVCGAIRCPTCLVKCTTCAYYVCHDSHKCNPEGKKRGAVCGRCVECCLDGPNTGVENNGDKIT